MEIKNKYVKEFNLTGNCVVDVDKICRYWNDKFVISTWKNENETEYTLQIFGKKKNLRDLKVRISEQQAKQIISKLSLIYVSAGIPRSAGSYRKREFICNEILRLNQLGREKENELGIICTKIHNYKKSFGI